MDCVQPFLSEAVPGYSLLRIPKALSALSFPNLRISDGNDQEKRRRKNCLEAEEKEKKERYEASMKKEQLEKERKEDKWIFIRSAYKNEVEDIIRHYLCWVSIDI